MTYREGIELDNRRWTGRRVLYIDGNIYTVKGVDYNGALLIDKRAQYTETTAVSMWDVQVIEEAQ